MSKIKSCDDLSPDNLLQLEIDETRLKELFPIFYEKLQKKKLDPKFIKEKEEGISDELTFINELVEEENDKFDTSNMDYIYKKKDCIIINIENNNNQSITNYSIIDFHGTACDDHSAFIIDDYYLLIHVSRAAGQSGSLGIWDTRLNNWCFTHSDEGFVPCSYKYNKEDDSFIIESSAYYYGQDLIETKYVINKNRELIEIED